MISVLFLFALGLTVGHLLIDMPFARNRTNGQRHGMIS